jgi:hypothetical protein
MPGHGQNVDRIEQHFSTDCVSKSGKSAIMWNIVETIITARGAIPALLLASLVTGCASINDTRDQGKIDTADSVQDTPRAERVFRYQIHVADALLVQYPFMEILEKADPAIVNAEERITESCGPLTQAVLTHVNEGKPSLQLRLRVMTTIDDCERAAQEMDNLLAGAALADSI